MSLKDGYVSQFDTIIGLSIIDSKRGASMKYILLGDNLSIKKLNIKDKRDIELIKRLKEDEMIFGRNGYLFSLRDQIKNKKINSTNLYNTSYGIYNDQCAVGYLYLSAILEKLSLVDVSYGILEEERRKGYASKVVEAVAHLILEDRKNNIESVSLTIDRSNQASQILARKLNFHINMHLSGRRNIVYEKTRSDIQKIL